MRLGVEVVGCMGYSISEFTVLYQKKKKKFQWLSRFRIDAITLFGLPAVGPHGFHAIGRCALLFPLCTSGQSNLIQSCRVHPSNC